MHYRISLLLVWTITAAFFFIFCGELENPWQDPSNSVIKGERSLLGFPSTVNEYKEYPCSLYVVLPELSDSLVVTMDSSGGKKVLWRLRPLSAADTAIALIITVPGGAEPPLRVYLYRKNGTVDSLVKNLMVRHSPSVTPQAPTYSTFVSVPANPIFSITDLDGDIRSCQIWIDSTTGQAIVPQLTRVGATQATVTCAITSPSFDSVMVFAQALDSAGNTSAMARCLVYVADTGKPVLSLVRITPSTGDTLVRNLPCTITLHVKDDSPIDSARFTDSAGTNVRQMTVINDTAGAVIAALDSGKHVYRVTAWDRAGNVGRLNIPINYTGSVKYKFVISGMIDRTVNENAAIPSINLTTSVTITPDPLIATWKDSIQWQVLETKVGIGILATLNPATKIVSFSVPDSEWSGAESFTFMADWPGMATGYAGATYTINPVNDPPRITWKGSCMKTAFDSLVVFADTCAFDPDNKSNTLSWTQDTSRSHYFQLLYLSTIKISKTTAESKATIIDPRININLWNRSWKIVPKPGLKFIPIGKELVWSGTDTLRLIVSDGTLKDTGNVIVSVRSTCK
jgi:hypothetical protein